MNFLNSKSAFGSPLKASSYILNSQHGYIALTSAIIISFLLITITISLGFSGFLGRFNILDSESKEKSLALAEACVEQAILDISYGTYYSTDHAVDFDQDSMNDCTIKLSQPDLPQSGQTTIKTQAVFNKSYTNLKIIIDSNTLSTISFEECANLGGSC